MVNPNTREAETDISVLGQPGLHSKFKASLVYLASEYQMSLWWWLSRQSACHPGVRTWVWTPWTLGELGALAHICNLQWGWRQGTPQKLMARCPDTHGRQEIIWNRVEGSDRCPRLSSDLQVCAPVRGREARQCPGLKDKQGKQKLRGLGWSATRDHC